jgi:hypothetical protein
MHIGVERMRVTLASTLVALSSISASKTLTTLDLNKIRATPFADEAARGGSSMRLAKTATSFADGITHDAKSFVDDRFDKARKKRE